MHRLCICTRRAACPARPCRLWGESRNPDPVPRVEVSTSVGSLRIGYSTNFIQAVPPSSMVPTIRMGDADRASASFPLP